MEFGWLLTNVLCIVGTGYGWLNPFAGLMIYYLFSVLRPEFLWFWAFEGGGGHYSLLVALSTLSGWMMSGFGDFTKIKGVFFPVLGLMVYLACGLFTTELIAINKDVAWDALDIQLKIGLMAIVTFSLVRTAKQIKLFAWVLTGSLGYLGWVFCSQSYFDQWNRLEIRGFGGIDNNGAAMIMVMGVPLAFFILLSNRQWWVKGLCFVGILCMMNTVLLSNSRGGMLGLCMVGFILFLLAIFYLPRKGLTITLAVIIVGIGLWLAGPGTRARFMTIFAEHLDDSAESRYSTWSAAYNCMIDHPMGVGPRNFNLIAQEYGLARGKSVHNLFLQTAADYGVLGALGLAVFYFGTVWCTFWAARLPAASRLVWPRYYCHMVTISMTGFLVCSQFIGMESVETAFLISILGLITVGYLHRVSETEVAAEQGALLELQQVPPPQEEGSEGLAAY